METREDHERTQIVCAGCGKPKDLGCIVCWNCFKYCATPFKWAGVPLEKWLAAGGPNGTQAA